MVALHHPWVRSFEGLVPNTAPRLVDVGVGADGGVCLNTGTCIRYHYCDRAGSRAGIGSEGQGIAVAVGHHARVAGNFHASTAGIQQSARWSVSQSTSLSVRQGVCQPYNRVTSLLHLPCCLHPAANKAVSRSFCQSISLGVALPPRKPCSIPQHHLQEVGSTGM